MSNDETFLVFVYGSLRKNEVNHGLLTGADQLCKQCWVQGSLYDTGLGYPAAVIDSAGRLYGELYRVNSEILEALDRLEGYYGLGRDNYYERVKLKIYFDKGFEDALAYVFPKNRIVGMKRIEEGDWSCHRLLGGKDEILYFSYGSCMDDERFKEANVSHYFQNVLGRGVLDGYSLKFTRKAHDGGRADIVEDGGVVEGKAYLIPTEAIEYLYQREGVILCIYRPLVVSVTIDGVLKNNVLTFTVVNKEKEEIAPPRWYINEIIHGGEPVVSAAYLRQFKERVFSLNLD